MSLSDLASIGSFVSGIAVLISLIYLAQQVRQAERNQRALINQGRSARNIGINALMLEDSDAWFSGNKGSGDLSEGKFLKYLVMSEALWTSAEDDFWQFRAGLLPSASFDHTKTTMLMLLGLPGNRSIWELSRLRHSADFTAFVDQLAVTAAASQPVDPYSAWKAALAQARAGAPEVSMGVPT